jgi:hypothetical protein
VAIGDEDGVRPRSSVPGILAHPADNSAGCRYGTFVSGELGVSGSDNLEAQARGGGVEAVPVPAYDDRDAHSLDHEERGALVEPWSGLGDVEVGAAGRRQRHPTADR